MPPLEGPYCQAAGLQPLGELLITEMMLRGMILEVDHFPQRSYARAYEMLVENDYPAAGSHGNNQRRPHLRARRHLHHGLRPLPRSDRTGATVQGFKDKIALITERGGYPAEGFGFDLNGFAGARGPRFGDGPCARPAERSDHLSLHVLRGRRRVRGSRCSATRGWTSTPRA
jgi:hypothetical protein